jgi:hypothetical protein
MYNARRGGHAPGHLRGAFCEWIDEACTVTSMWPDVIARLRGTPPTVDGEQVSADKLIGQLWNCSDVMPHGLCNDLELPGGSTYAHGVRLLKDVLARGSRH